MFKTILVPVDLSAPELYRDAARVAAETARQSNAKIRFLTVVSAFPASVSQYLPPEAHAHVIEEAKTQLKMLASETGLGEAASSVVREGVIYHEVLAEAREAGADLIVMGSHRPAMSTYLIGSNAARIVRHATCSVMVVR